MKNAFMLGLLLFFPVGVRCADGVRVLDGVSFGDRRDGLKLDLYVPKVEAPAAGFPALVWIHGNNQERSTARALRFCATLAEAGYVCASIDYRPIDNESGAISDAKNAVRHLRANAASLHVDPARIGVVGLSMGGFLALMVGFTDGRPEFEPKSPYPGVSSGVGAVIDFFGVTRRPGLDARDFIRADAPPVLIVHGTADERVSHFQSVALDDALRAKKVKDRLVLLEGLGHGFDITPSADNPLPMDLRPVVLDFLREYLPVR